MRKRLVGLLLVAMLVGGCSEPVDLPDRADPAVQAEEARLTAILESIEDVDHILVPMPRECSVRLLGQEGDTAYVWANCFGPSIDTEFGSERPGVGGPMRIDGDRVSMPGDGSQYSEDIKEMFPADIARAILDGDDRIFP